MIEPYSAGVPILPGEYILNVFARNDPREIQDALNYLANGDTARAEAILGEWLAARGHALDELPGLIDRRRKEMRL